MQRSLLTGNLDRPSKIGTGISCLNLAGFLGFAGILSGCDWD